MWSLYVTRNSSIFVSKLRCQGSSTTELGLLNLGLLSLLFYNLQSGRVRALLLSALSYLVATALLASF